MDETVAVNGDEYNKENLQQAVEAIVDDVDAAYPETGGRVAHVGDVVVEGDGFDDGDMTIVNLADISYLDVENNEVEYVEGAETTWTNANDVLETVYGDDFETFVEREFRLERIEGRAFMEDTNDFTTNQVRDTIGSTTGSNLDDSEDVGIRYICYGDGRNNFDTDTQPESGDEPSLRIGLEDLRDE